MLKKLYRYVSDPAQLAVALYYKSRRAYEKGHNRYAHVLKGLNQMLTGVEISPEAVIGKNLKIYHGNGIVIGRGVVIGDDVTIWQQVTLGVVDITITHDVDHRVFPIVEDGAKLCAGAKILGPVTVGRNALVGANAVVLEDVPADHVAVGIPARILPKK